MMENLEVLGEWVVDRNTALFATRFIRKFRPRPELDLDKLKKDLGASAGGVSELPGQENAYGHYVKSGSLTFFTKGTLGSGKVPYLSCELGMIFRIDRARETRLNPLSLELYAGFYGHHKIWAEEWRPGLKIFPTEQKAMAIYSSLLAKALAQAKTQDVERRHPALKKFEIP